MDMKTKQQAYEDERAKNETNEEIETSLLFHIPVRTTTPGMSQAWMKRTRHNNAI